MTIVVPLIVLDRLGGSEAVVGIVFALSGVAGVISVALVRTHRLARPGMDAAGRARWPSWRPSTLLMLPAANTTDVVLGLVALRRIASRSSSGLLNGPMDIGLFTMRQRRTDPAMFGRAFAVSMAFNFLGYPIGAVIAGLLASDVTRCRDLARGRRLRAGARCWLR